MAKRGTIKVLEALGYVSAILLGVSELLPVTGPIRPFRLIGIVLAVIVVVRLLAVNAKLALKAQGGRASEAGGEEETVE